MTAKLLPEQLKQIHDEIEDLKESVDILIHAVDASYNASSKNSFNKLVDVNKAFDDDGAPHIYTTLPMALYIAIPKFAQMLAAEVTLSWYNGVLGKEWFPDKFLEVPKGFGTGLVALLTWVYHQ